MSDIKKVISQRLVTHQDRTGKKTSLVDIFSALRKNNDARILRHTRLDDSHSTIYITDNKNGYKIYEKKGKGDKVSKKVYRVDSKNKLKNILKKSAKNLKEKFAENNNGNNNDNELNLVPDINDNEEQNQGNSNHNNEVEVHPVHNNNHNLKDYEQLMMDDLEKNAVIKKESKKTKKKNKRNRRKNKKNKNQDDVKILSNQKDLNEKTKKKRNRRKRKRSRKGKKN